MRPSIDCFVHHEVRVCRKERHLTFRSRRSAQCAYASTSSRIERRSAALLGKTVRCLLMSRSLKLRVTGRKRDIRRQSGRPGQ
jgi:hypothetical protein